jgi:PAS domain S-box-containing protein
MALLTISPLQPTAAAQVKETRRVLILNELGPASPGINLIDGEIRARLERSPYQIELYNESLETTLFPDPAIQKEFFDSYIHKYRDRKPDVIIAVGPTPVHFLVQSHDKFFTDTPVVFCFTTPEMVGNPTLDSSFTGVWEMPDFTKTVEVVLKLLPSTRHIVVVGGVLPYDRGNEAIIKDGLRRYEARFDVTYLTDLDMPTLLERLTRLPKDSIILHAGISEDAAGNRYIIATQSNPMVVQAANAPIFPAGDMADVDVGQGAIGGYLTSFAKEGEIAAEDAERILNGDKAKDVPIVRGANAYIFDWRALRRWGLKESNLPPGSIVLNRPPTLWESFRWYVIGGMTLILVEALLISGLLVQRAKRKRAEASLIIANERLAKDLVENTQITKALQKSETKFSKVFRLSPVAKTLTRLKDERCVDLNEAFEHLGGWRRDEVLGRTLAEIGIWANPDERLRFVEDLKRETHIRDHEAHFRTKSGEIRTVLRSSDLVEIDGELCGLTVIVDITERKLADEAVAGMSRKLLEAQEKERARIGRELHDDVNQRLALMSVEIDRMKQVSPVTYGELRSRMDELGKRASEISAVVQSLSHELHSSKLEYLGLVSAMKGFCKEFGGKQNVEVAFDSEGMPASVPQEISICLFRVMQEGLHNALKHSGVKLFDVELLGWPTEIRLTVRDLGKGFDTELAKDAPGLGLVSMQERVRLVNGTISITSGPGSGTKIDVRVPLSAGEQTELAKLAGA